jgi:3-hydroxybutyryl-CoA dehydratase
MNDQESEIRRQTDAEATPGPEVKLGEASASKARALCWSDPFERLSVGQRFDSGPRTVSDTDVIVFSALTGDWHPQHCDQAWAASSPFGERIAQGMLILSLAVGLVPLDPERVLALRRVGDVVFKRPVHLNEAISVDGELVALRPIGENAGLADFIWAIRNQDDAVVCRANVQVLWRGDGGVGEQAAPGFWHAPITDGASTGEFIPLPL